MTKEVAISGHFLAILHIAPPPPPILQNDTWNFCPRYRWATGAQAPCGGACRECAFQCGKPQRTSLIRMRAHALVHLPPWAPETAGSFFWDTCAHLRAGSLTSRGLEWVLACRVDRPSSAPREPALRNKHYSRGCACTYALAVAEKCGRHELPRTIDACCERNRCELPELHSQRFFPLPFAIRNASC